MSDARPTPDPTDDTVTASRPSPRWYRRPVVVIGAVLAGAFAVVALALTQPWLIFVDEQVDEALPTAAVEAEPDPATESTPELTEATETAEATEEAAAEPTEPAAPAEPVELARGEFISHEHATTGTALVLQLPDGSRVLRIEGLDTSNGPDLHVWLSDAPVVEGRDGWFLFDDGQFVDLGELKGNQGNQNYEIPADVDLSVLTSVSIWCERFSVSFGAADLATA